MCWLIGGDIQLGLLVRAPKVALERIFESVLVVFEEVPDLGNLCLPELDRLGPSR